MVKLVVDNDIISRDAVLKLLRERHDMYMNMAGWQRDANGKWEGSNRDAARERDPGCNTYVGHANAIHSAMALIRHLETYKDKRG